jgi:hypothetical protein
MSNLHLLIADQAVVGLALSGKRLNDLLPWSLFLVLFRLGIDTWTESNRLLQRHRRAKSFAAAPSNSPCAAAADSQTARQEGTRLEIPIDRWSVRIGLLLLHLWLLLVKLNPWLRRL